MSLRIKKCLGYGILDLLYDEETQEVQDPRVNLEVLDNLHKVKQEFLGWVLSVSQANLEDTLKNLGVNSLNIETFWHRIRRFKDQHKDRARHQALSPVTYDYSGDPKVLVFHPITQIDWYRSSDIIDNYQQEGMSPEVLDLKERGYSAGIFPYDTKVCRPPTIGTPDVLFESQNSLEYFKEKIKKGVLNPGDFNRLVGRWDNSLDPLVTGDLLQHLIQDWNCPIPTSIILFAHHSKIFKDFNTVYQLQPALYTYWS